MGIRSYTCSRASRSRRTLCPKCVKTTKAAERTTNEVVYSVQRLPPPSAVVLFFFECGSISDILEETCEETRWAVRRTPVRSARSQENSTAATSPGARHSLFVCKMDNIFDSLLPAVDSNEEWRDICSTSSASVQVVFSVLRCQCWHPTAGGGVEWRWERVQEWIPSGNLSRLH